MSYSHSSHNFSCYNLYLMVKNETASFDNIIQRSYVWELARRCLFIHSLAIEIPIKYIYAKRVQTSSKKKIYDILDGQQRMITIYKYLNDEFAMIDGLEPVEFFNVVTNQDEIEDMSGKKFSELSEGLQEKLKSYNINMIYFDDITTKEERILFRRQNNGKPLSTKSKSLASCVDIENLVDIGDHNLFKEMLSESARKNKNQAIIVMKSWVMMNQDIEDISFESRYFNPLMEKTEISEEEKRKLIQVFDIIENTHFVLLERKEKRVAKKLYTETHTISLVPFFSKAVENNITEDNMADWILEFYKPIDGDTSVSKEYNNAVGSGSAKSVNIQIRNSELLKSFEEFFKEDDNVVENVEEYDKNDNEDRDLLSGSGSFVDGILEDMKDSEIDNM